MNTLIVLNDAPYGSERSCNGLRLATSLAGAGETVRIFLFGDAVACGKGGQQLPTGYYSIERMLVGLAKRGVEIGACGSCLDARGIDEKELATGPRRSSMAQLTEWTLSADRVLTF